MPAILDGEEAIRKWLDFAEVPTQEAVKLIQPTENIVFHPVSTFVNSVRNDTPECLAPIELGAKKVSAGVGSARTCRGGDGVRGCPRAGTVLPGSPRGCSHHTGTSGMLESSSPERIPFPPVPEINRVALCQGLSAK